MSRLTIQTVESAAPEARERLAAAQKASGFLPNLLGVLANAPIALETYQEVSQINARSGLSAAEREVVQITAATRNGCDFCAAGHTKIALKKARMPEDLVRALRTTQALSDPKLNALALFTLAVIDNRGRVSDEELKNFLDAGYEESHVLEVILGVSLSTLCNYANNVAQTPINPELQAYAEPYAKEAEHPIARSGGDTTSPALADDPALAAIRAQIDNELVPLVTSIDREGFYPEDYLRSLGAAGGFSAFVPREFGGQGLSLARQIEVTTAVAAQCGSTAFLVWCQSVSAWYLLHSPNDEVRERYLAPVAKGELLSGSGMSNTVKHLAGIEKIYLRARRDGDDYIIDGFVPWVSNLGSGHLLISAAEVAEEGYIMFAVRCDTPGVQLRPCPEFSGMNGTQTLVLNFDGARVSAADIIAHPHQFEDYMARIKPGFVLGQVGMGLGVAEGCLETIHRCNASRNTTRANVNVFLDDQEDALAEELRKLKARAAIYAAQTQGGQAALVNVLRLRAQASELALRAANSAVLHAGARGYVMNNPAQRRLREAVFVSIVTPALKHLRKEIHDLEAVPAKAEAA